MQLLHSLALQGQHPAAGPQPRPNVWIQLVDASSRHDRRKLGVVAVVYDLPELLVRPRRAATGLKLVENQHRGVPDLIKELRIADLAAGAEASPEMVQQVRDMGEENWLAVLDAPVRDGRRKVSLASAGRTRQYEPSVWGSCVVDGGCIGLPKAVPDLRVARQAFHVDGLEREAAQVTDIAVPDQPRRPLFCDPLLLAPTGQDPAKIGVAGGYLGREPTAPAADVTRVRRPFRLDWDVRFPPSGRCGPSSISQPF